jgi:uncharacterized protein (DUF433 family)
VATVLEPVSLPLTLDEHGALRIMGSRVPTASSLARQGLPQWSDCGRYRDYPTLKLSDVYALLGYHPWHREEVNAYLGEQERLADAKRQELEHRYPQKGLSEQLLARLQNLSSESQ